MGDGIVASCMMMERRIVHRDTYVDATKALLIGRRFVAFRIDSNCEVSEIGPPAICPGDTQYYYDDTYTHDVGDDGSEYFSGLEGIRDEGAIIKMNDDVVVGFALNGLNPVFPNGGEDVEARYDASFMFHQCIGWVARLNRANLTWEVGPKTTIERHYYQNANEVWDGNAGVSAETDPMGAVAMSSSLAVVSLGMFEYGLADEHLDWDGDGDYTDEDVNQELDTSPGNLGDQEVGYLKLKAVSVNTSDLTMSVINGVRVTDRYTTGGWFARTDQPYKLSNTRGVIIYSRPSERGYATVWHHDGSGAISGFTTTEWVDDEGFDFPPTPSMTTEAEAAAYELSVREFLQNLRTDWDGMAHKALYFPVSVKLSDTLFAVTGNESYFYHRFMTTLRVNDDDTVSVMDYKPLHGHEDSYQMMPIGTEGWVWVSFRDTTPQKQNEDPQEGYTQQGAYLLPSGMSMALFHVDLTTGEIDDYVPLGTGSDHTRYKDSDFLTVPFNHTFWLGGRGIASPRWARAFPYGTDHVLIANTTTLTLLSPLAQTFPITTMGQNPFVTSPGLSGPNLDLWYVDLTAYEPDAEILDQVEHERRVRSYAGREP